MLALLGQVAAIAEELLGHVGRRRLQCRVTVVQVGDLHCATPIAHTSHHTSHITHHTQMECSVELVRLSEGETVANSNLNQKRLLVLSTVLDSNSTRDSQRQNRAHVLRPPQRVQERQQVQQFFVAWIRAHPVGYRNCVFCTCRGNLCQREREREREREKEKERKREQNGRVCVRGLNVYATGELSTMITCDRSRFSTARSLTKLPR